MPLSLKAVSVMTSPSIMQCGKVNGLISSFLPRISAYRSSGIGAAIRSLVLADLKSDNPRRNASALSLP
jgi:hypothetical protein